MMRGNDPQTGMPPSFTVDAEVSSYAREDWVPEADSSAQVGAEFRTEVLAERRAITKLAEAHQVGFHYPQRFDGV